MPALLMLAVAAAVHGLAPAPAVVDVAAGRLVQVAVSVEGRPSEIYRAADGSGRHYFEAREGACYEVRLDNRSAGRVGVRMHVDGLNVISGLEAPAGPAAGPGRLYVLEAGASVAVRGWRTSLAQVRRFTFVDERDSYAARSGQANGKLGWIELAVFRERQALAAVSPLREWMRPPPRLEKPGREAPETAAARDDSLAAAGTPAAPAQGRAGNAPRSYPGTGWGDATRDRAVLVAFDPEPVPAEQVTLRYEYGPALRALGIPVRPERDRLLERERGLGFARPAWR